MKFKISILTILLATILTPTANAHSTLVASNPQSGTVISQLPQQVWLKFNEKLLVLGNKQVNRISLVGPKGEYLKNPITVAGEKISARLNLKSDVGSYKFIWRVVSEDGHVVSGSFKFTVR